MTNANGPRSTGARGLLAIAVLAIAASLTFVGSAFAGEPTGPFAVFKECPRHTEGVNFCVYAQVESGEVTIGSSAVPITNTITLQGGYERAEDEAETFFGALNGETLSKTPEPVPGGLAGLVKCDEITGGGLLEILARASCELVFENALTGVNATTELAKPASDIGINSDNLVNEEGVALSLPVKLHLENPLLGSECYIGSSASPVTFNLTTGPTSPPEPNKSISGKFGDYATREYEGLTYTELTNNTLVDNSFSAPGVSGCGGVLSSVLDPVIDAKLGLPSAAGHNTAIQNAKQELTLAKHVIENEEK